MDTERTLDLSRCIPLALVSDGVILARDGALTIGWELHLPEMYSVTQEEYDTWPPRPCAPSPTGR